MAAPFKLDQPTGIIRGSNGKFQEVSAPVEGTLSNPLEAERLGVAPQDWAPGIGQNTAPLGNPAIPWPPAATGPKPFKLGG